jgi:hypothetical protein
MNRTYFNVLRSSVMEFINKINADTYFILPNVIGLIFATIGWTNSEIIWLGWCGFALFVLSITAEVIIKKYFRPSKSDMIAHTYNLIKELEASLPNNYKWIREDYAATKDLESSTLLVTDSVDLTPPRQLGVYIRPDGDIDIRLNLLGTLEQYYEAHFIVHDVEVSEAKKAIISFIEDILDEQRVFVVSGKFIQGYDRFISVDDLNYQSQAAFELIASWRGTFDKGIK